MNDEYLLREVHEEFAGRMEDEHKRINHRLGKVEETIGEINRLTLSVQSLAESVQRMCKEQERQSERLQTLEDRDGDNLKLVAPDLTDRFITIQPGTNVDEGITVVPGILYSDGKFIENPLKPTDVLIKYQNLLLRRDAEYKPVMKMLVATNTNLSDAQALSLATEMFPIWPEGVNNEGKYRQGQIVIHDGMRYRIVQDVTPQEHQKPGSEGMLAIYRPIQFIAPTA